MNSIKELQENNQIFDAHIHVGYFPRIDGKGGEAYYFSPAKIAGYMKRAGIGEFIFSSTNAIWDKTGAVMHKEEKELKSIVGDTAHAFFWISGEYIDADKNLEKLPEFYEGYKLHGGETNWMQRPKELKRIFAIAQERKMPLQIHTGRYDKFNSIEFYLPYCIEFCGINIDLAHGQPHSGAIDALKKCDNVYVDTSFMSLDEIITLNEIASQKIMFGSDFPAVLNYTLANGKKVLQREIRKNRKANNRNILFMNAKSYLKGR